MAKCARTFSGSGSKQLKSSRFDTDMPSYDVPSYLKGPRSFVRELSASPEQLPKYYRKTILDRIQGLCTKLENGIVRSSQFQQSYEYKQKESDQKLEKQKREISLSLDKNNELRGRRQTKKLDKVVKHLNHVQEIRERRLHTLENETNEHFQDQIERQKEMSLFMEQRNHLTESFTLKNQERILEFQEEKREAEHAEYEHNKVKGNALTDRMEQVLSKRESILAQKQEKLSLYMKQREDSIEKNRKTQSLSVETHRLNNLALKLERIKINNAVVEKSNEQFAKHSKDEWAKKSQAISFNQSKMRQAEQSKNQVLYNKLKQPSVFHRQPSKINLDQAINHVLSNHSKLKQQEESKKQQVLRQHLEYTASNKILKVALDKFNDFTRKANFLSKFDSP